jgi:lipoprotein-anchoring transpeptidase ErfK/SrfK
MPVALELRMNLKKMVLAMAILSALACSKEEAAKTPNRADDVVAKATTKVADAFDVATPVGKPDDPKQREQERFDERWRQLEAFRQAEAQKIAVQQANAAQQQQQAANANIKFVTGQKETLKGLDANGINAAPVNVPIKGDVAGPSVLKTQVYLDRVRFSVGALDGRWGRNSAIAVWWYQRSRGMEPTGLLDEATFRSLASDAGAVPAVVQHTLTADDVKGPFTTLPEDVYDKAKLDCLCYESLQEKLSEQFHTTADLLDTLNPNVKFSELQAGATITVPNVREAVTADNPNIARIVVSIAGNTFNAFDSADRLIFHAPTTLGSQYDPSPRETLKVVKVAHDPHFHYQPKLFHEVPDDEPEANLQPGPNSPVGVVWIALSKEHFGIHGTGDPDSIGYASSHGCIRLTNWDAREVSHGVSPNVQVEFVDTRKKDAPKVAGAE